MAKNTALEKIAKKVLANMKTTSDNHGIDPITIIIIISVILSLIRVIQECRKNRTMIKDKNTKASLLKQDVQNLILKDSWWNRMRLQRVIRQNLSKEQYKVYGKDLQNSLMEVGINLTEDEAYTLTEATE